MKVGRHLARLRSRFRLTVWLWPVSTPSSGALKRTCYIIITIIIATSVGDASDVGDGLASWPVTVGVVEVGVVDTRYGVSQPGADAKR